MLQSQKCQWTTAGGQLAGLLVICRSTCCLLTTPQPSTFNPQQLTARRWRLLACQPACSIAGWAGHTGSLLFQTRAVGVFRACHSGRHAISTELIGSARHVHCKAGQTRTQTSVWLGAL